MKRATSELFAPYRFLGVVCSEVQPSVRSTFVGRRAMISMLCPIDNIILQYNAAKLRVVGMSDPLPGKITCVASSSSCVYAAVEKYIAVLPFCRDAAQFINVPAPVKNMILLGTLLVAVDIENGISVIDTENECQTSLYLDGSDTFEISSIVHPSTLLNKILIGSSTGKLRIVNVRTGKIVHEFARSFDSHITNIVQTTAVEIVAIGLANGQVVLFNIKTDKILHQFRHDSSISAIAFRNDGEATMVTADKSGQLAVWNLEKQELIGKVPNGHKGPVTMLHFAHGEPIMISASEDNSLRTWIFDGADGMPRQLVELEGHGKPATSLRFLNKTHVVSSGLDGSLRKYDIASLTMRQKLGTAATMKKSDAKKRGIDFDEVRMEPVVEMDVGWAREAAWDNVLCLHKNQLEVTTWTSRNNTMGTVKMLHERFRKNQKLIGTVATSVCLSPCGNFAFIGYSSGHIDKFNVQSGRHVHSFAEAKPEDVADEAIGKKKKKQDGAPAHEAKITALSVDRRGVELVSGSEDGALKFWNLRTGNCVVRIRTPSLAIKKSRPCIANNLLAIACEDKQGKPSVVVIDVICHKIVRTFDQVGDGKVNALEFSADGRWLLVADAKCFIRVFELATSDLIDVILFSKPCIDIAFNTTGEYMATVHEDEKAVFVWANKTMFCVHVPIRALPMSYEPTWEEAARKNNNRSFAKLVIDDDDDEDMLDEEARRLRDLQIDPSLITYSGLAPSRWANLPDLDVIKQRNKPTEAPRKIKQAPFFLTAAPTLEGFEFDLGTEDAESDKKELQMKRSLLELESSFTSLLRKAKSPQDLQAAFTSLKTMSVSAIDFQIRSMSAEVLANFFRMLHEILKSRKDFELVQAYMATAIKIHRNELWRHDEDDSELSQVLSELESEQEKCWKQYEELLLHDTAVVQWIKNALL